MINTKRFKKLRSMQDIKLEKAKLRYEMLKTENILADNLDYFQSYFTIGAIISRFNRVLTTTLKTYSMITGILGWRKKSDKNSRVEE